MCNLNLKAELCQIDTLMDIHVTMEALPKPVGSTSTPPANGLSDDAILKFKSDLQSR